MTKVEPLSGDWIFEHHLHASKPWEEYLTHIADVEEVWQGQFTIKSDLDTPELEIKQPAEGRAIIKKMNEMLSIRADKRYSVARFTNSEQEQRDCDRLERMCYAYENELFTTTQSDTFALAGTLMLIRGKVGLQTVYERKAHTPKIRIKTWDPAEYFPVYSDDGISWFTTEQWMYRWELIDFFGNLTDKEVEKLANLPDLTKGRDEDGKEYDIDLDEQVQVLQYWNEDWMAWTVEDTLIQKYEHGYGRMTLREARLSATPFKNKRWSQEPFIGPIVDALKMKASLTSKAANSVEAYYYPYVLVQNENGEVEVFPSQSMVDNPVPMAKDSQVTILNPHSNQGELKVLIDLLDNDIAKTSVPDPAWSMSSGEESGFSKSLTLNQIKDSVADVRNQAEMCYGLTMGDVLWMHQKYAPSGGWEYTMVEPDGKARIQTITAEDIGNHQKVKVKITPALPQDLLQMFTMRDMATKRDPMTGMMLMSPETANDVIGLSDVIGDITQDKERIERDYLLMKDPETQAIYTQSLKVKNSSWIRQMKKEIEQTERKDMRRDVAHTQKAIEQGLTDDIVIPAEVLADPNKLMQMAQLMLQGQTAQMALDAVQQGMPLGMPGEPVAEGMAGQPQAQAPVSPETQAFMQQFMGGQEPNGFTGYEGVNPEAAPAAMMGAQPRPGLDQAALDIEAAQTLERRGAKQPAR
jgi:hypothetical protein